MARPAAPVAKKTSLTTSTSPAWVPGAYYALCAFFVLEGGYDIVESIASSRQKFMGETVGMGFAQYLGIAIGLITAIIGVGLLLRIEVIRGIVNFFCGLRILFGLFGLLGALGATMLVGFWGFIMVAMNVVDIATAAFMIYLIGETEKSAPNLH